MIDLETLRLQNNQHNWKFGIIQVTMTRNFISMKFEIMNNGGPPADLLINQGIRDNVSGHTTRAPPAGFELTTKRFQR